MTKNNSCVSTGVSERGIFMTFEKVLAERKDQTIYKDGDSTIKVFSEKYPKSDVLNIWKCYS